jgi:hypothetical protein
METVRTLLWIGQIERRADGPHLRLPPLLFACALLSGSLCTTYTLFTPQIKNAANYVAE